MSQCLVVVVNKTQARFLTLEAPDPLEQSGPHLIEHPDIHNPVQHQAGRELWANAKSGGNHGSAKQGHGYDDHRQNHLQEFDRRFAQSIMVEVSRALQTHHTQRLILVAEPQILGYLRQSLAATLPKTLATQELAKDLCKLSQQEIHRYLKDKQLLPWRVKQPH